MKKKLLILGAGNAQIDAIEYCKSMGYEVVGCSYTTVDSGISHLNYFEQIDIKDTERVADLAKRYEVIAVYSVGSDLAMPTAMKVSEMLELPHFISSETASNCHSKGRMRSTLGTDFSGNAKFMLCYSLEDAMSYCDFPAMMKPVDSQGQRGCFKVESPADIKKNFTLSLEHSTEGCVIIEEYIDGFESSVNAYIQDGEMKFAVISDRHAFDEYPGGIIKEHRLPSSHVNDAVQLRTIKVCKEAAAKLGIYNGPCYFQIKFRDGIEPVIIEVAPRLDGCHMWNLIKHYCGADLIDACFRHLLRGEVVLDDKYEMPREEYSLEFMSMAPNATFTKSDFDVFGAEDVHYYYQDGDRVLKINGFIEKCGYIIRKTGRIIG